MTTNGTCSSLEALAAIEHYAAGLQPAYLDLMTNTVFASLSVPFLVSLFYVSTATRRHSVMFILVVLSVVLALAQYVYQVILRLDSLYHPSEVSGTLTQGILTSILVLRDLPNFVADLALFVRLVAVYPSKTTPRRVMITVLGPAILVKLLRVVSMVIIYVYDGQDRPGSGLFIYWSAWERAWLIVNRALTVVDNAYPTAFFLWKLKPAFQSGLPSGAGRASMDVTDSLSGRIRVLFWIAMTNCVIPVPLCIAQLAQVIATPNSTAFAYFQQYVVLSSVVCVAFATIWASKTSRPAPHVELATEPLRFRHAQTSETGEMDPESEVIPVVGKPQRYPMQVRVDLRQETG